MLAEEQERSYSLEKRYWWFVGVRTVVATLLSSTANGKGRLDVLDVGCGTGALLDDLAPSTNRLIGIDRSAVALRYCAMRGHSALLQADAQHLPIASGSFDVITAIGVIEHLDDDGAFLGEAHRVLRPAGRLVLLTSAFPMLWSAHDTANQHRRRYRRRGLHRQVERAGFRTVRLSYLNFLLFPFIAAATMIHRLLFGTAPARARRLLPAVPEIGNRILTWLLQIEARLAALISLPWGVSMIGVFRKADAAE